MPTLPDLIRTAAITFRDTLYPARCVNCAAFGQWLCAKCEATLLPVTAAQRCPNCDARWDQPGNCPRCFAWQSLDSGHAAFAMEGAGRAVVHGLKYRRVEDLAPLMARHIRPLRESYPFDVAIAVPLHRSRERDRGFNQAGMILGSTGWTIAEGRLRRIRKTRTQVGLHSTERRNNVRGAFRYEGPSLAGLTVAVLDDVITTGSTADECAAVLRDAGARSVIALAFARASYDTALDRPIPD